MSAPPPNASSNGFHSSTASRSRRFGYPMNSGKAMLARTGSEHFGRGLSGVGKRIALQGQQVRPHLADEARDDADARGEVDPIAVDLQGMWRPMTSEPFALEPHAVQGEVGDRDWSREGVEPADRLPRRPAVASGGDRRGRARGAVRTVSIRAWGLHRHGWWHYLACSQASRLNKAWHSVLQSASDPFARRRPTARG